MEMKIRLKTYPMSLPKIMEVFALCQHFVSDQKITHLKIFYYFFFSNVAQINSLF